MRETPDVQNAKRILILKLGAIGDVIMAFPLSRYLAARGDHVTWVCGQSVEPLVRMFSGAQHVEVVDDRKLFTRDLKSKLLTFAKILWSFCGRSFDEILIGHSDPRYRALTALARGRRFYFGSKIAGTRTPTGSRHHSYEYMKLATREDSGSAISPAQHGPPPLEKWSGKGSRVIALAPGGAKNLLADDFLRRWPIQHYRELAEKLIDQGFEVEIYGAASDRWVLEAFQGLQIKSYVGDLDLREFLVALSKVEVLVTHDSGPLHLGGLAQVPVLGLFGPTRSYWRFPLGNPGQALELSSPLACQPCYDGKNFAKCTANRCLSSIQPEAALEAVLRIVR